MSLKRTITSVTLVSGLTVGTLAFAAPAFSHGYVNGPKSRAILCKEGVNVNCGAVAYEPQSLEYLKGFPEYGPADGKIASANGQFGGSLDAQSSTRWAKQTSHRDRSYLTGPTPPRTQRRSGITT